MKKFAYFLVSVVLGLVLMFLINRSVIADYATIPLPWWWKGPYYQMLDGEPKTGHTGMPFTYLKFTDDRGANYWNDSAIALNAAVGVGLGFGFAVGGKKMFRRHGKVS